MSDTNSYALVRGPVDLTSCDLEPVHLIGTIQSHGALLIFQHQSGALVEASANWRNFIPESSASTSLGELFASEIADELQAIEASDRAIVLGQRLPNGAEISAHRVGEHLLVEIEDTEQANPFDPIASLNSVMHGLSRAQTSQAYLADLASGLQKALGIDRVMIYKFLPDWAGEVVAESCRGTSEYLGLRFPATDIPHPAREVFTRVWVRHIADIAARTVPVGGESQDKTELDLTQVGIRAASPIHLEYLANMDVQASLTLSLRLGDRLWGLVACHHSTPYRLRPSARASLEVLAQIASLQLSKHQQEQTREDRQEAEQRLDQLNANLEAADEAHLSQHLTALETLIDCDAVAIHEDQRWSRRAGLPLETLDRLLSWMKAESDSQGMLFHRNDLPPELVPGYVGILAVAPSEAQGLLALWLRREQSQSVRWAGNPDKTERQPTGRLNPRASFAEYVEITQGKSLPWTEIDLWKANRFAEVMRALSMRLHRRLEQRNLALTRSNRELDTFAYMASHDLKEPLRGIHNYATFLKEDYGDRLDGEGLVFLDGLTSLSHRMTVLLDSLLAYSRLNSQRLDVKDCDLGALARETCSLLQVTRKADMQIIDPLPVVQAYPPFLAEILVNLLTNAIKYSDQPDRKVQIGALPDGNDPDYDVFYVKDNGIGIAPEFHEEIFRLFRRLHGEGQRGDGSGVGLTIVEKMVERHGGKIWVESAVGEGSTFFVALPRLVSGAPDD